MLGQAVSASSGYRGEEKRMTYSTPLQAAEALKRGGFSFVPLKIDGSKEPSIKWKPFQERKPTDQEMTGWYGNGATRGIAALQGKISGNAETIDFDLAELYDLFSEELAKRAPGLGSKLLVAKTPRPGYQVTYRCSIIGRNRALAFGERPARPDDDPKSVYENDAGDFVVKFATIETRGEGGYIVAVGSPARVHKNNRPYELLNGDYEHVPTITSAERDIIFAICEALSDIPPPPESECEYRERIRRERKPGELLPGDDFNERGDVKQLLKDAGWTPCREDRYGELWTRPGKETSEGHSARLFPNGNLYVFTSNASPLEQNRCYDPFGLFAKLKNHTIAAATRILAGLGYGKKTSRVPEAESIAASSGALFDPSDINLRTDFGNAARFLEQHGADTRYSYARKKFFSFTGKLWSDDQAIVEHRASQVVRSLKHAQYPNADEKAAFTHYINSQKPERRNAMLTIARSEIGIQFEAFDADLEIFNVQNGIVDLRTGKLLEHDPKYLCTKISPVRYDQAAECQTWRRFLFEIFNNNEELVGFIRRAVGYSLSGLTREQVFFLLYGTGKNGKSTFLNVLSRLLGDYATHAQMDTFVSRHRNNNGHSEDLARLRGARLVTAIESEESKRLSEGLVKQVTGCDPVTASYKHENSFTYIPIFKLWLAANHKPIIRGTDDGIWRRPLMIPFNVQFEKDPRKVGAGKKLADPKLEAKLFAELPGILNWAIEGFQEWDDDGLNPPKIVTDATEQYRQDSDILGQFIEECLTRKDTRGQGGEKAGAIYTRYCQWAEANGEFKITQTAFGTSMTERGFSKKNIGGRVIYLDTFLVAEEDPAL
jgi:P4 family phage/plasmid primase-like protien